MMFVTTFKLIFKHLNFLFKILSYPTFDNLLGRKRGKDKTGHSLNGSVLGYTDPAGEKLLPQNGTLNRYSF